MKRGDSVEVEWALDTGERVWWPALVWAACPASGRLRLAYAAAHGHPAHLAACRALDHEHLLDTAHQLVLRHRPAAAEPTFTPTDMAQLSADTLEGEDLEEARRALREEVPEEQQRTLWEGMEEFRQRTRAALEQLRDQPEITAADIHRLLHE